jgi:hypothetical protein
MGWGARGNVWLLRNDRIAGRIVGCTAGRMKHLTLDRATFGPLRAPMRPIRTCSAGAPS